MSSKSKSSKLKSSKLKSSKLKSSKLKSSKLKSSNLMSLKSMWMNKPRTGLLPFGTKTCLVAPNWDVFTTYPGGRVAGWPGGRVARWVGGLSETGNKAISASIEIEVELSCGWAWQNNKFLKDLNQEILSKHLFPPFWLEVSLLCLLCI